MCSTFSKHASPKGYPIEPACKHEHESQLTGSRSSSRCRGGGLLVVVVSSKIININPRKVVAVLASSKIWSSIKLQEIRVSTNLQFAGKKNMSFAISPNIPKINKGQCLILMLRVEM